MKLFVCDHCGNSIYFENARCEKCGHALGYAGEHDAMLSLNQEGGVWTSPLLSGQPFLYCANSAHGACNWLVPARPGGDPYCTACRHNETIPPVGDPVHLHQWQAIERAKKRLFYSLLRLGLPLRSRAEDPAHGLAFRFLADDAYAPEKVITGHDNGIVTIALAEADDAERERRRLGMGEPYRTLLGHFRHEIGHYVWPLLVDGQNLDAFRILFGDERADYAGALAAHYAHGAPAGWFHTHISAYASAHPWEDFAESFAHYLHIIDTVEMAAAFGLRTRPQTLDDNLALPAVAFDPYGDADMEAIVAHWIPLAGLINNLNRAVGQPDAYPFILTPPVIEKLGFINTLVRKRGAKS